jgi:hypothetical protein
MANVHGKNTTLLLNSNDFSQYFNNVDMAKAVDVAESTTFGKNSKTYVTGAKDGTITLGGFFDRTADAVIQPLIASDIVIAVGVDGTDATKRVTFANGNITNYGVSAPVGDIVAVSMDFQADTGLHVGTSTASGTARDNSTSTANGGAGFLIVTASSGTSPTLDAKITHSADDSTYADLVTFTQATGTTQEVKTVAKGTTVNRYLKAEFTLGGTNPSFTAVVGFGRDS